MASGTKWLISCFLVILLFLQVFAEASLDNGMEILNGEEHVTGLRKKPHAPRINCNFKCAKRCMKASRKNVCSRACGTCCERCQCVPSGYYGNKNSCPCYASLRTHGKKPKCP